MTKTYRLFGETAVRDIACEFPIYIVYTFQLKIRKEFFMNVMEFYAF